MTDFTLHNLIQPNLISPTELSCCEAIQFAVAATNQNRLIEWQPVFAVDSMSAFTWPARPTAI